MTNHLAGFLRGEFEGVCGVHTPARFGKGEGRLDTSLQVPMSNWKKGRGALPLRRFYRGSLDGCRSTNTRDIADWL